MCERRHCKRVIEVAQQLLDTRRAACLACSIHHTQPEIGKRAIHLRHAHRSALLPRYRRRWRKPVRLMKSRNVWQAKGSVRWLWKAQRAAPLPELAAKWWSWRRGQAAEVQHAARGQRRAGARYRARGRSRLGYSAEPCQVAADDPWCRAWVVHGRGREQHWHATGWRGR